jgi:hypothetical protein
VFVHGSGRNVGMTNLLETTWRHAGIETLDGEKLELLEGISSVNQASHRLWVDPSRGYSVLQFEQTIEPELIPVLGEITEVQLWKVEELEEVAEGIWMPVRAVSTIAGLKPDGTRDVYTQSELRMDVTSVNEDLPPETFRLEIPDGYSVDDRVLGALYITGEKQSAEKFSDVSDRLRQQSELDSSLLPAPSRIDVPADRLVKSVDLELPEAARSKRGPSIAILALLIGGISAGALGRRWRKIR